jgi:hypothetical protein
VHLDRSSTLFAQSSSAGHGLIGAPWGPVLAPPAPLFFFFSDPLTSWRAVLP